MEVRMTLSYTATGGSASIDLQTLLDKSGVNVMSFGAIPNNLTFDQSGAFNNAIAYAVAHNIGKVVVPCGYYACNILITQSGVLLECGQPQDWFTPQAYLTPWDIANPVIQIGNDTGYVYGVTLNNVCLNGSGPNGQGVTGLFLGGGSNGVNISNFSCENFTGNGLLIGGSSNYAVEYINFSNCNFVGNYTQAYNSVITVNTGTGSAWTSAIYLSNCNLLSNAYGTCGILLNSASLIWNGGWLQIGINGITITGTGGGISGSGTQIEYSTGGATIVVPSATNTCISSYMSGPMTINTSDQIKDSNGVLHDINQPGLAPESEIGVFCHHIGLQYFNGYNGNGAAATDASMYISGGYNRTGYFDIGNNIGTPVMARLVSNGTFVVYANGGTQLIVNGVLNATNYATIWASTGTNQVSIAAANTSGTGLVPLNLASQNGAPVLANGNAILTTAEAATTHTSAAPTPTASTSAVMMAVGGTITPVLSTRVLVTISGQMANSSAGDGATVDLRISATASQTAPTNSTGVTGTLLGIAQTATSVTAAQKSGFSITAIATGLTIGAAYWIDASLMAVTGGTASITGVTVTAIEV